MESITEYRIEDSKLIYRIVVKVNDNFYLSAEDFNFFPNKEASQWVDIDQIIPFALFQKLFTSISSQRIMELVNQAKARDLNYHPPNFLNYYTIDFSKYNEAQEALKNLAACKEIDTVYLEINPVYSPAVNRDGNPLNTQQNYLDPAPLGIDAGYAWKLKGGDGLGSVTFIDIEQGWMENHEDVPVLTLPLSGISHPFFKDHGTAVLGILTMKDNSIGGIGITPKAKGYILSQWRPDGYFNIADALLTSIHYLGFGDVLLIQSQAYDSRTEKAMPVEIYDANFHLIRLATALGIIVIEPAGNGDNFYGYDLDLFLSLAGQTPLNRTSKDFRDSGAIIVAAATSNAPHKKIDFSNYGSRVDCYAWGENVLTAGYFPASSGKATNTYTKTFSGTSSASAIITGATIALQNIIESNLHCRYDPFKIRAILSNVMLGTSSVNGHSIDKIGVMPDLKNILKDMLQVNFPSDKKHRHQKRQEIFEPKNVEVL